MSLNMLKSILTSSNSIVIQVRKLYSWIKTEPEHFIIAPAVPCFVEYVLV